MISCVIFDCDGTLVDSEYLCNVALEIKLQEYGIKSNASEMMERFRGAKLSVIIEQLESEGDIHFDKDFIPSYRKVVDRLFEQRLKACAGVVETLEAIQLPICVASSGPVAKICKALSLTGLMSYFDGKVFSSYEINSWKPDPDIFIHAAKKMRVEIEQCAVVEDSAIGIDAAISAGATPIYYNPDGRHDAIDGINVVSHMNQLPKLIRSLS